MKKFIIIPLLFFAFCAVAKEPVEQEQITNGSIMPPKPHKADINEPPKTLRLPTSLIIGLMQYISQKPSSETAALFLDMQHCLQAQGGTNIDEATKAAAAKACPELQ